MAGSWQHPPGVGEQLRCVLTALLCWLSAWGFWVAWRTPLALDDGLWVKLGVAMLMLEFIAIHSSTMIAELAAAGPRMRRLAWVLVAGYGLFALSLLWVFDSLQVGLLIGALMGARLHDMLRPAQGRERAYGRRRSIVSVALYVSLASATLFLPIDPGGITPDLLDTVWPDRGGGRWELEPQRALAMGWAYFLLIGVAELRPPSPVWIED